MKKMLIVSLLVSICSMSFAASGDPCGAGFTYVANSDGYCCRKVSTTPTPSGSSACVPPSVPGTVTLSYTSTFSRDQKFCCDGGAFFVIGTTADADRCKNAAGVEFLMNGKKYCCSKPIRG